MKGHLGPSTGLNAKGKEPERNAVGAVDAGDDTLPVSNAEGNKSERTVVEGIHLTDGTNDVGKSAAVNSAAAAASTSAAVTNDDDRVWDKSPVVTFESYFYEQYHHGYISRIIYRDKVRQILRGDERSKENPKEFIGHQVL